MVPYDVLIDPMSLPSHPVLKDSSKTEDDMFEEIKKKEDESVSPLSNFYNGKYHETKHDYYFFFYSHIISVLDSKPYLMCYLPMCLCEALYLSTVSLPL
jgi:hypothetical protein